MIRTATVGERVLPRYDGQSLLNVPGSICAALDVPTSGVAPALDEMVLPPALTAGVTKVLLLVVDGLGRGQLDAGVAADAAPTIAGLLDRAGSGDPDVSIATITSVFPSSTMPALASLNTGQTPGRHGLIGWTVYLQEFGEAVEIARWGPAARAGTYQDAELGGFDPRAFFGVETLAQRLDRAGVRPVAICPASHRGSGLSAMLFQGADWCGHYATSSIFPMVEQALAQGRPRERTSIYAYWPTLDTVGHHAGPEGAEHTEELATFDFALGRWLRAHRRRGDLLLLLTADHGHVSSHPDHMVRLDTHPVLMADLLSTPTGERRLAYLHARPGRVGAIRAYCAEVLAAVAELLDPGEAFERGLFGPGPISPAARRRAGDLILLARGDHQFVAPFSQHQPALPLIGNHGALAEQEMLVPLLAMRL